MVESVFLGAKIKYMHHDQIIKFAIVPLTTNNRIVIVFNDSSKMIGHFVPSAVNLTRENKWSFIQGPNSDSVAEIIDGNKIISINIKPAT